MQQKETTYLPSKLLFVFATYWPFPCSPHVVEECLLFWGVFMHPHLPNWLLTWLAIHIYIYILVLLLFAARISKRKSVCSFFCLPTFGCVVSRCKTYCKCLNKNIQFPWFHLSFNLIFSLREESHPPTRWAQKRLYSNIPITNGRK